MATFRLPATPNTFRFSRFRLDRQLPPNTAVLKIQRTTEGAAVVLTVSGRLDAENVSELCVSLDAIAVGAAIVLDLTDLVPADRDVVRLLREFEADERIVLRNCPAYIRIWMAAEDIQ